jgi:uncharacterized protein YbjT (DUF2867 family)
MEIRTPWNEGDGAGRPAATRRVAVGGATGLVGREILRQLLDDPSVREVHTFGRRAPAVRHERLTAHVVDFAAMPALPPLDEVYLALGTTIKQAGSQAAFRAVDFDANLAVARAAAAAGARRLGLVSAMGADATSRVFYNRVKGELEAALDGVGFDALVIARPSLLVGDRKAIGQPTRLAEKLALVAGHVLRPIVPANYRPIAAAEVAAALVRRVPHAEGRHILLSGDCP